MNVTFLNALDVEEIDDDNWQLISPFQASIDNSGDIKLLTVPIGFKTDFASVPRLPVVYALYGNRAHKPAVLHDYLYSLGGTEKDREYADNVLRAAIISDTKDVATAENMWAAVRLAGGSHWKYTS